MLLMSAKIKLANQHCLVIVGTCLVIVRTDAGQEAGFSLAPPGPTEMSVGARLDELAQPITSLLDGGR